MVFPLDLRSFGAHGTAYCETMFFRLSTRGFTKHYKRYSSRIVTKSLKSHFGMLTVMCGTGYRNGNVNANLSPQGCLSRRYCSIFPKRRRNWTDRSMDFIKYSKEDLHKLDRRNLQLICKSIGINASLKISVIIENIEDHMHRNGLSELSFFPFHTDFKSDVNVNFDAAPLSIKLENETTGKFERMYESKYVSVTTVLRETRSVEDARRIAEWKEREIDVLGEEYFDKIVKKSLTAGSNLHESVAQWLKDFHMYEMKEAEEFKKNVSRIRTKDNRMETKANFIYQKLSEYGDGLEESLDFRRSQSILNTFYDIDNILAVESGVIHEPLGYAGTLDCIVQFRNKIYLIDWKTSKRRKSSWRSCYDYPVQLAAYAAAVNADPAYDFAVKNVALVFASENDCPATVLTLTMDECLPYYYEWQGRLKQYKKLMKERENNAFYVSSGL